MVYRGKPSRGCDLCRKRKIRCDEKRPQCGQCIKHRTTCPGYRTLDGMNFVDENHHAQDAVNHRNKTARTDGYLSRAVRYNTPPIAQNSEQGSLSLLRPSCNGADLAVTYFYSSFVAPSYLGFIPASDRLIDVSTSLGASVQCTALVAFANRFGSPCDVQHARRRYARALLLANEALHDPQSAKTPDTLASIHFLSMFENIDCDTQDRLTAWQTHIKGNLALIQYMSREDLIRPYSLPVFNHMRMPVLISCIWAQTAVPEYFIAAMDYAYDKANHKIPLERLAHQLFKFGIEYIGLRSAVRCKHLTDPIEIISTGQNIDHQLSLWYDEAANNDPDWSYQRVHDHFASADEVWNETYYVYPTYRASMMWYFYRCIREMLAGLIGFFLRKAYPRSKLEQHLRLVRINCQLLDDICAGVPWCLGHLQEGMGYASGGYGTVFPLFHVGEIILLMVRNKRDLCDVQIEAATTLEEKYQAVTSLRRSRSSRAAQLLWIIGRLNFIADKLGIAQARVFARLLRRQWEMACDEQPDLYITDSEKRRIRVIRSSRSLHQGCSPHDLESDTKQESNTELASQIARVAGDKEKPESWSDVLSRRNTPLPNALI